MWSRTQHGGSGGAGRLPLATHNLHLRKQNTRQPEGPRWVKRSALCPGEPVGFLAGRELDFIFLVLSLVPGLSLLSPEGGPRRLLASRDAGGGCWVGSRREDGGGRCPGVSELRPSVWEPSAREADSTGQTLAKRTEWGSPPGECGLGGAVGRGPRTGARPPAATGSHVSCFHSGGPAGLSAFPFLTLAHLSRTTEACNNKEVWGGVGGKKFLIYS